MERMTTPTTRFVFLPKESSPPGGSRSDKKRLFEGKVVR
jgi:hypothetical protein